MRIWHKDLVQVLPKKQLLGQWRELCFIAKAVSQNGTPNHILVNKVTQYSDEHLHYYATLVADEMERRGYKCDFSKFTQYIQPKENHISYDTLFLRWHDDRYLMQCFANLQEKYDCGGISIQEYYRIYEVVHKHFGRLADDILIKGWFSCN